jgi:hypothetical protein
MWQNAIMTYKDKTKSKTCDYCGATFYRDKRCTYKWWASARFCSRSCSAKSGAMQADKIWGTLEERFWCKTDKRGDDECWPWRGATRKEGYGVISQNGKQRIATHVSLELHGVTVADGFWALHKCDNPNCVNPNHLYVGTPKQNARDAVIRERFGRKLTAKQALEIYHSSLPCEDLVKKYSVSSSLVYHIKTGRKWSAVTQGAHQYAGEA